MTLLADLSLPNTLTPSEQNWGQRSRTAVFLGGSTTQRLVRPAPRWAVTMTWRNLDALQRRQLIAFLSECQGQASTCLIPYLTQEACQATTMRELLTDPADLTTGNWQMQDVDTVLDFGRSRLSANTGGSRGNVNQVISSAGNYWYAFYGFSRAGDDEASIFAGTVGVASNDILAATNITGRPSVNVAQKTSGTDMRVSVRGQDSLGVGLYSYTDFVSAQRCGRVDGASQTGNSLAVKDVEADALLLRGGEFVEVNGQIVMLTSDARSDSAGDVTLMFTPALRNSPADESYVLFNVPRCRMHLDSSVAQWSEQPHRLGTPLTSVSATFVEALD